MTEDRMKQIEVEFEWALLLLYVGLGGETAISIIEHLENALSQAQIECCIKNATHRADRWNDHDGFKQPYNLSFWDSVESNSTEEVL